MDKKDILVIVFTVVIVVGIGGIVNIVLDGAIVGQGINFGENLNRKVCSDSDDGIDIENYGVVTKGTFTYEDYCDRDLDSEPGYYDLVTEENLNEGDYIMHYEFYCENNQVVKGVSHQPYEAPTIREDYTCEDGEITIYIEHEIDQIESI